MLNVASAIISPKSPIEAIFGADIDPKSVTPSTITLTRIYDNAPVPLTLIISRSKLSIKSVSDLISGTEYALSITSGITSVHGSAFASYSTSFWTGGTFVPPGQRSYWNFENNSQDVIGNMDPVAADVVGIYYVNGRSLAAGKAASFNGINSIIEVAGGSSLLSQEFTVSFWMYLDSAEAGGKRRNTYVLGIGNSHGMEFDVDSTFNWCRFAQGYVLEDKRTVRDDFKYAGDGITDEGTTVNQPVGSTGLKQRLDRTWSHIVMSFKDTVRIRSLYINGELMYKQDLNFLTSVNVDSVSLPLNTVTSLKFIPDTNIPALYDEKLVFGFWQSKASTYGGPKVSYTNTSADHFKGKLDDIRFFNRALTDTEIQMMYDDEKP